MYDFTCAIYALNDPPIKPIRLWPEHQGSPHPAPARRKVLVVDDEHLVADSVRAVLEHAGFEARAAYDAWHALDLIPAFQPDFLLSDVLMPRMNGVELAIAIHTMYPGTRIVLFSGQAGVADLLDAARQRGYNFQLLPKPIHPEALISHLRET